MSFHTCFATARFLGLVIFGAAVGPLSAPGFAASAVPMPDHVVVVVMENHSFAEIVDGGQAPFIAHLAERGAMFTNAFAVAHPSQPNYFALFSGSTHGVTDDRFHTLRAPTLATALRAAGKSFVGYVEHGSPRKHNPWESFADAQEVERDLGAFPGDFTKLPTVGFVIPNLENDMHDGSIEQGDAWLKRHLGAYAKWCAAHNDLLIVTFDEDNGHENNHILTIFVGGPVKPGRYQERITHYSVLRTIDAMFGLSPIGHDAEEPPITDVWRAASMPNTSD
jgi:phosphatidylinositol-3-phosphatase